MCGAIELSLTPPYSLTNTQSCSVSHSESGQCENHVFAHRKPPNGNEIFHGGIYTILIQPEAMVYRTQCKREKSHITIADDNIHDQHFMYRRV